MIILYVTCFLILFYIWRFKLEPNYYFNLILPPIFYNEHLVNPGSLFKSNNHSLFHVNVFKSQYEPSNFMLKIAPQDYYFFIENGRIIYHPNGDSIDGIRVQYTCSPDFELAYELPLKKDVTANPKIICHRNLKYLKKYVYTNEIYFEIFDSLRKPIKVLNSFFSKIQTIDGMNRLTLANPLTGGCSRFL